MTRDGERPYGSHTMRRSSRPLPRSFYARPTIQVCRELLGCLLVHEHPEGRCTGRIVEVEAYLAPEDRASHACGNRKTPRNAVMHGPKGHAYVYFIYGMHWCLNVTTGDTNAPQAVLIRSVEPLEGVEIQARRRGLATSACNGREIAGGPARLCQAMAVDGNRNGHDLCLPPLFVTSGEPAAPDRIVCTTRIGVEYAGLWKDAPLRFLLRDHPCVSRKPGIVYHLDEAWQPDGRVSIR